MLRTKILGGFLIAVAVSIVACGGGAEEANENKDDGPVTVKTQAATTQEIPTYLEASGSLSSDAKSSVAATIGGKVVAVNFDVGSYVRRGQALVALDSGDASLRLKQARASVGQAQTAVKQAQVGVEQAQANLQQAQARLGLKSGQQFNIESFSQVISIRAQLNLAEREYIRYSRLLQTGDVSKSAYDQIKAQRDQLVGQLSEARSNAAVAMKAIGIAEEGVAAARAQESSARAALATSQTQVDQAQKGVSDNVIYAPISGYISVRNANLGEYVSPNQGGSIATILRTSTLRLKINIPEQETAGIAVGQGISAQVAAYPDRSFAGTITRVLPEIDPQSRTLTVEAEIQNSDGALKPGEFATVRITQTKSTLAVMIPAKAVKSDGETSRIFVVKEGIAEERVVQTGLLEGDNIEIKEGLAENEMVVVSDLSTIQDGAIVQQ